MHISSAVFLCSAPDLESCPDESLPEFAFIGRSNVGKSSLLNMLVGKQGLARVSPRPGFTKFINIFTVNKTWRLVDLPGYGFAQVAREERAKFSGAVAGYLKRRNNLRGVFALIDSGLPPQDIDLAFVEWLADKAIPFVLVFTKIDREKPGVVEANIEAFKARVGEWSELLPEVLTCSAVARSGRKALLDVIEAALPAAPDKPVASPADEGRTSGLPDDVLPPIGRGMSIRATRQGKSKPSGRRPW